jgi:signal transduction histidine kinase
VASRYTEAQDLLATLRTQVLLSSVRVRDALLDPSPTAVAENRELVEMSYRLILMVLADYQPVMGSTNESVQVDRLRREVEQFHETSMQVLAEATGRSPAQVREALNRHLGPRREAAVAISEEVQTLNRLAFVRHQNDIVQIHQAAGLASRRRLGVALVIGLSVLLLSSVYAGRLEARLRVQMDRDARMSRELQEMAAKVLNAQEEERRTIARELHDEVGQVLTAIKVELEVAQHTIEAEGGSAAPLTEVQTITGGALQTVRNLSQLLHPAALDDLGLAAAIDSSLRGLARRQAIRAELRQQGLVERLPREVELAAYRIVQEAVTNVGKHANATHCFVHLTHLPDRLLIEVEDDGVGFIEDIDRPIVARGLGLISVRERVSRLGGTFNILSTPGQGTRLVVSLPEKMPAHA